MSRHRAPRRPGRAVAVRLAFAGVVGAGILALLAPADPPPAATTPPPVTMGTVDTTTAATPTRVRIPSIDVDSALALLGTDPAGALVPPENFAEAGWFSGGPSPGEVGPAVLAGHVDSWTGPAVFARLQEVAAGDVVLVDRADGTAVRFAVVRVERYPKDGFPTGEVYGPTPGAEIRLITCGGHFDRTERTYLENVVVYGRLVPVRAGGDDAT